MVDFFQALKEEMRKIYEVDYVRILSLIEGREGRV